MQGFSNYSGAMEADLKLLEEKLSQLIALCQTLRSENQELRQGLAKAQDDAKQLKENMSLASQRLKVLIERLPQDEIGKGAQ
jgi:cell division protein ZapB